jgi:hypothetical protein
MSCHYCGRQGILTRDHKVPKSKGGTKADGNIVRACKMCNIIKGEQDYRSFYSSIKWFLHEFGAAYMQADDTDMKQVRKWQKRFVSWQKARAARRRTIEA